MQDLMRFLPTLVGQLENNQTAREAFAFAGWRKTAGAALRDRTAPVRLENEKLIVAVKDATWKTNLEKLAGQMVFELNSLLRMQLVTFIEFVVDEAAVGAEQDWKPVEDETAQLLVEAEITDDLRAAAESIKDEKLRKLFILAAGNCLVRKTKMGM